MLEGGGKLQSRLLGFESHFYHLSAVFDLGHGHVSPFFHTPGNNDNNDFIGFGGVIGAIASNSIALCKAA